MTIWSNHKTGRATCILQTLCCNLKLLQLLLLLLLWAAPLPKDHSHTMLSWHSCSRELMSSNCQVMSSSFCRYSITFPFSWSSWSALWSWREEDTSHSCTPYIDLQTSCDTTTNCHVHKLSVPCVMASRFKVLARGAAPLQSWYSERNANKAARKAW